MPNNTTLNIGVKYNVDQASVNNLKRSLQSIKSINIKDFKGSANELAQIKQIAGQVQIALKNAFNVKLDSLNVQKFNKQIQNSVGSIDKVYNSFSKIGAQGKNAFSNMANSVLTTNMQLKQTNSLISQMGQTMVNTVKWGIASSVMNNFTNSVRQAFDYVKALDSSLNDIRIVTGQSSNQMANFAIQANNAAQSLGRSTMDYTKAALTFYQQGLDEASVQARTESVLKAQNITGAGQEMADYLTAVWNGYKVANEEAELYVDKLAAVADSSASNMSQLAIAMSKVASSANLLGVPVDKLNAQIATITATTRQAPETVGNALKTIYSRINDIATGADDAEISLGNYSSKMMEVGISVLDANGKLRDTGDVIDEIGAKWETLSHEQQIYLARTMAGQRQYNNLLALFENWGKYSDLVNVSMDAQGTTAEKNAIYMESLSAKMEQLGAAGERVKAALIDENDLKGIVDFGTGAVNLFGSLIQSIGGGKNAILSFGSIFAQVFSGTIAKELNNAIVNFQNFKNNAQIKQNDILATQQYGQSKGYSSGVIKQMVDAKRAAQDYYDFMDAAQINQYNQYVRNIGQIKNEIQLRKQQKKNIDIITAALKRKGADDDTIIARTKNALDQVIAQRGNLKSINRQVLELSGNISKATGQNLFKRIEESVRLVRANLGDAFTSKQMGGQQVLDLLDRIAEKGRYSTEQIRTLSGAWSSFLAGADKPLKDVLNVQDVDAELEKLRSSLSLVQNQADKYLNSVRQFATVKSFVGFATGISQAISGISNLINLTKIWQDNTLSTGEKIKQVFTNIGMSIPLVVNGLSQVVKSYSSVNQALKLGFLTRSGEIAAIETQIAAQAIKQGWDEAQTIAVTKKTIAQKIHNTSLQEAVFWYGKLILAAAPYIAVAAAVGVAVYALYKSYNKAADAAQKAAQSTKKAREAYQKSNESYKNLKSSLNDLSSATDNFNELTKGTQEWRDALQEVNEKVITLVQEFPELQSEITTSQEGLLGLTQTGQEKVRQLYQQRALANQFVYTKSNQESVQAQNYSLITDLSRKIDGIGGLTPEQLQQVISAINEHGSYILQNSSWLEQNTSLSQDDIDAVLDNTDKIIDLSNQVSANTKAAQNLTNSILSSQIVNNDYYKNSSDQQLFIKLATAAINQAAAQFDQSKYAIGDNGDIDNPAIIKRYQELFPDNEYGSTLSVFDKYTYRFKNAENDWEYIDASVIKNAIAYQEAVKQSSDIYQQVNNTIQSLGEKEKDLISLFSKNNGSLSLDFSKISFNDLTQLRNNQELINTIAQIYDVDPEDIKERLSTTQQEISSATIQYFSSLPKTVVDGINSYITLENSGDITQQIRQSIGAMLENSYAKGLQEFQNTQQVLKGLDIQEILPFQQIVNDLTGTDISLDDFKETLSQAGIVLDDVSDNQLQKFIDQIKGIAQVIAPEQIYKTIHDVINKLQDGDTISADDAQKLRDSGLELDEYFTHMADGSLRLKVSAKEFYDYANNQSLQGFKENIQNLNKQISDLDQLNNFKHSAASAGDNADQVFKDFSSSAYEHNVSKGHYSSTLLQQQLDFLHAIGQQDTIITQVQGKRLNHQKITKDQLNQIAQLVFKQRGAWQGVGQTQEQLQNQLKLYQEELAYIDLQQLTSLKQLREEFYNTQTNQELPEEDRIAREQAILETYSVMRDKYLEDQLDRLDITRQQYDATYDQLQEHLEETSDSFNELSQAEQQIQLDQLTSRVYDLGDALDQLKNISKDSLDSIQELINSDAITTPEFYEQIGQLQAALQGIFQTDIDPSFIAQNFDLIRQLAQGDITALDELSIALAQDFTAQIRAEADTQSAIDAVNEFDAFLSTVDLQDLQTGITLDDAGFTSALQEFAALAGLTKDEINTLLGEIGFEPQVTSQEIPMNQVQQDEQTGRYVYHYRDPVQDIDVPIDVTTQMTTAQAGATSITVPIINGKKIKFSGGSRTGSYTRPSISAPKSSGGSGGKSGGGGKAKQPTSVKPQKLSEAKDSIKDRSDVYHDINLALEKQEDKLDDIQKQQKKLVNKDRLKNLQQQNDELEKQKSLLDQKTGIAASELVRLKNELVDDLGNAISFDPNGQIANYNEALDQARDNYNDAIDNYNNKVWAAQKEYNDYITKYNLMSGQAQEANKLELERQKLIMDQAKKSAQKSLDLEKEKYDAIKNNVKEYDDTLKLQRDIANQQQEIQEQIYDNLIAISKIKVDFSIDTGEFERDWLDFENKFIKKLDKDDFLGNAKASAKELMSYFNSKQVQQTANQIKKIRDQIAIMSAGGPSNIYGNNLAQAKEDLEEYMKQQMDDLQDIQDLVDDIKDSYLNAIDDARDKMDDQIDQYERVNDLVEHNMKMVQLLYGDKAYDSMQKYYNLQQKNNESELESLKKQQDYWKKKMDNEVVGSDAWKKFKDNLDDVTDNLNNKLEDMIENLSDKWQNRVNGIIARLNNALTGGRGLDYLDEQWDYINNYDDQFLDTFESKTGIDEVERLYQSTIDGLAGSPKSQQALNKLMNDQLKLLRQKDHLTEYDLERAKASLQVEKARLALEEARDNKTKMRLRRDSQGNYTYQYVADEQKLGDLQAALADAQANLYNTDKEHYKQNLNNLYDTYKDYIQKMRDLTEEYNNTQDEEERKRIQARIDLLKESTNKVMNGLTQDNKYLLQYLNGSFFDGMGVDTSTFTMEEQMQIMEQNIPQMQSNIQDLANTIVGQGGILNATADAMKEINDATLEYDKNVSNMLTSAGTSLQTIEQAVNSEGNALDKNILNAEKLITANDELIKSCQAQIEAMEQLLDYMDKYLNKIMNVQTLLSNLRSAYNTGQNLNGSNLTADNIGMENWGLDTTSRMQYTGNPATDAATVKQEINALMAQYEKFLAGMSIATFNTGGYTGSWGDAEGRLAFLHQGELVLNQDDTRNILSAVQMVRSIANAINGFASGEINSLMSNATGLLGGISNTEQLDQNVHIEANFPNVTQHTEIEQAFENLVNMASMRASGYRD